MGWTAGWGEGEGYGGGCEERLLAHGGSFTKKCQKMIMRDKEVVS